MADAGRCPLFRGAMPSVLWGEGIDEGPNRIFRAADRRAIIPVFVSIISIRFFCTGDGLRAAQRRALDLAGAERRSPGALGLAYAARVPWAWPMPLGCLGPGRCR